MHFPSFHNNNFLKADKVTVIDKIIDVLFLWILPAWVLPNHITALRLIATPPTLILLANGYYTIGALVFLAVAATDALDGALARTRDKITHWGMLFDPLADKLLIIPTIIILMIAHLPRWVALLVVSTELLIIIFALFWREKGRTVQANMWGKIKMILEVLGICLLFVSIIFSLPVLIGVASGILVISVLCAFLSLLTYGI